MRAWRVTFYVREVEVLSDQEATGRLSGSPHIGVTVVDGRPAFVDEIAVKQEPFRVLNTCLAPGFMARLADLEHPELP